MLKFIKNENNRSLLTWVATALIGAISISMTIYNYLHNQDTLLIEDLRAIEAFIPEFGDTEESLSTSRPSPFNCGKNEFEEQLINKQLCEASDYVVFPNLNFTDQLLDITIVNKSDKTIVISNISLDVIESYQVANQPGGDSAEPINKLTKVEISHEGAIPVHVSVSCSYESDKEFYKSFVLEEFSINDEKCYFSAELENGDIFVSKSKLKNCKSSGIEATGTTSCQDLILIRNYEVKSPFSFAGTFTDPMRIPAGEPMRFDVKIKSFRDFPNNMVAKLNLDYGDYNIATLYFFTHDMGRLFPLMFR